jgi:uncharacterized protein
MRLFWKAILPVTGIMVLIGASAAMCASQRGSIDSKKISGTVAELRANANKGNARAEFDLGLIYYKGKGVPQDYAEAAGWYRKAAEQGYAKAQSNLGDLYFRGLGVPRNYSMAVYWSQKAADQGDVKGEAGLGYLYFYGAGLRQDYTQAAFWYRKAAANGEVAAQDALGYMYLHGQGVQQDRTEAVCWYRKAAVQGDPDAEQALRSLGAGSGIRRRSRWYELVTALIGFPAGLWFSLEFLLPGKKLRDWRQASTTLLGICFLADAGLSLYAFGHDIEYSPHREAFYIARFIFTSVAVLIIIAVVLRSRRQASVRR